MLIEKEYLYDGLFKINIMTTVTNDENNNKIVYSSYSLECCDVWYDKLGHVNYNFI
jgi:hypothetical protein